MDKIDTIKKEPEQKRTTQKKVLFLETYQKKCCCIMATCEAINISREIYYQWREKDKAFNDACIKKENELMNLAESQLMKNILSGKETSLIFYLVNRGKGRWKSINQMQLTGDKNNPLIFKVIDAKIKNGKSNDN